MLMWPRHNMPFEPLLSYWLGGIEIYDREETLGAAIWAFDPNQASDRLEVINRFIIPRYEDLSYRHKFVLFKLLENALSEPSFNFYAQFEADYDECTTIAWDETEIDDVRGFFEDIYKQVSERWSDDISKASLEDSSSW